VPDEQQYAAGKFAQGFGRRATFGCCSDCGETLLEITALICDPCRYKPENRTPEFAEREAGHRERISDLFRGVRDSSLTFQKVNAIYRKKRKEAAAA
jgi:hypothetical protein